MIQKFFHLTFFISAFFSKCLVAQNLPVSFDAESGVMGSDYRTVDTLGCTAVTIKTDAFSSTNPVNSKRVITYQITFPEAGTYNLYAHILVGPNSFNDDSYFYGNGFGTKTVTTDGDWKKVNSLAAGGYTNFKSVVDGSGPGSYGYWKWINISKFTGDGSQISFNVSAGALTQTFQIGARENGFYIDKFVFGKSGLFFTVANLTNGEAGSKVNPSEWPTTLPIAQGKSKFLGSAWDYDQSPFFAAYWNQLTPGNAGKWGSVEGTRNVMNWTVLDSTYKVAKKHHFLFKEHTLIWGAQQPSWIGGLDSATQRQEIEAWFSALAARYDSIDLIDVVNEPMNNAPNGMIPWGTTVPNVNYAKALGGAGKTGWDWIITAFKLARKYFPKSKLIMNEYNVINNTTATQNYIKIINLLKADTLIDGIGEQAHAFTTGGVSAATLKTNLDALAATGIPLYLTEVDIDGPTDLIQLQEMQRVFPIFWQHPAVKGITLWGFIYPVWRNAQGAYLVTPDGRDRPALTWLRAYVNDSVKLVQSIGVTSTTKDTVYVGETLKMNTSVLPINATIQNVTWSVNNSSLASIDTVGKITAKASGTVRITATAWDGSRVTGIKDIVIINRLVQSITVSSAGNKDTVLVSGTLQMNAAVLPANATNMAITWSVSPASLASMSSSGLLTATAKGKVTITATASDASGVTGTKDIIINDKPTNILSEKNFEGISIFPNPVFNGTITIFGIDKIKQIEIMDLTGRKISEFSDLKLSSINIPVKAKPGVYIIRLFDGQQSVYEKILVNNQ